MMKCDSLPLLLVSGILEVSLILIIYYSLGYGSVIFFNFGPPVIFFQTSITTWTSYLFILFSMFFHQICYCIIYEKVQPWIFNEIQNKNFIDVSYPRWQIILFINMYYAIMLMNSVFIVSAITTQFPFVLATLIAQTIASSYINNNYIKEKEESQYSPDEEQSPETYSKETQESDEDMV